MQEVCNIDITDSQHLFSEKKLNIVQKQDTKSTRQSHQCKSKVNLFSTHQSIQMRHDEHSECFADEFEYSSELQSCEQLLDYLIFDNLHKIIKTVKMTEILNELSILYTVITDQTSKSQLDDYYMNTVIKLAMNIIIKYELFLKEEESM